MTPTGRVESQCVQDCLGNREAFCLEKGFEVFLFFFSFFPNAQQKGSRFKGWGPGVQWLTSDLVKASAKRSQAPASVREAFACVARVSRPFGETQDR